MALPATTSLNRDSPPILSTTTGDPSTSKGSIVNSICGHEGTELQDLLKGVPAKNRGKRIAQRIEALLEQPIVPCEEGKDHYANCYGTILWTLGFDQTRTLAPNMSYGWPEDQAWDLCDTDNHPTHKHLLLRQFLEQAGYQTGAPLIMFDVGSRNCTTEDESNPDVYKMQGLDLRTFTIHDIGICIYLTVDNQDFIQTLRPGDILLFSEPNQHPYLVHGAMYLGEKEGEHMAFHKYGAGCDDSSNIELKSLEEIVGSSLELSLQGGRPVNQVEIYRSSLTEKEINALQKLLD